MKKIILIMATVFSGLALSQERVCETCDPRVSGDIVHRSSGFDSAFVGHAGIYVADNKFFHVTSVGSDIEAALQRVGWITFFSSEPGKLKDSWGAKRPASRPGGISSAEFTKLSTETQNLMEVGVMYDFKHVNQKGKFFPQDPTKQQLFAPGFMLFDCVGYVEGIYENPRRGLNINLTPNDQEEGVGLPLTVREQRDSPLVISVPST
jgi:hypothetical protein